ncbi:MAG: polyisoprenoid-binding protein [Desulfobacteraceae bacterium]|nr:MAG: polyisoprenoid-binding protein [Desulfobacteraceae bacterium]
MKTQRFNTISVLVTLLFLTAAPVMAENRYEIDPAHSSIVFSIKHFGVGNVYGRFNNPVGKLVFDEEKPENSSLVMEVNAVDVDTANQKRDTHLRSADFFNIEKFPVISFKSTGVTKLNPLEYEIKGDLTLLGKTKAATVKAQHIGSGKDPLGGYRTGFEAKFTIKRSDFGMDFMQGALGDEVQIITSIEALKQ